MRAFSKFPLRQPEKPLTHVDPEIAIVGRQHFGEIPAAGRKLKHIGPMESAELRSQELQVLFV